MTATENGSHCNAVLLRQELTFGSSAETESGLSPVSQRKRYSSGDSFDSAFENEDLQVKRITFAKVRSYSECAEPSPPVRRGILKHLLSHRVRFFSESSAESFQIANGNDSAQTGSNEDEDEHSRDHDSDENDSDKIKKTVRFSDTVHRQLYRSNSSILGQRKKNQRKQRNKKRKEEERLSSSAESVDQVMDSFEQLTVDSGTEIDVDVEAETACETPAPKTLTSKKNKKNKRGRNRGKSLENDLIFDLDL